MPSVHVHVEVTGDIRKLMEDVSHLENVDTAGAMAAIGEGLRESTIRRFDTSTGPDGKKWKTSLRVREKGGKTLVKTAKMKNSIHTEYDKTGMAVGTNSIKATTHQFGDKGRIIKPKRKKALHFKFNGKWITKKKVVVDIPARPFLGISEEDEEDIRKILDDMMRGD